MCGRGVTGFAARWTPLHAELAGQDLTDRGLVADGGFLFLADLHPNPGFLCCIISALLGLDGCLFSIGLSLMVDTFGL